MSTETIIMKLKNINGMILMLQNDLTNNEGGCTETDTAGTLEIMREYVENLVSDVATA